MSPVQIWVLASVREEIALSFVSSNNENGRIFNNADSFAMSFDAAWSKCQANEDNSKNNQDERLMIVLDTLKEHPFVQAAPDQALEIAKFRIRLLNLK